VTKDTKEYVTKDIVLITDYVRLLRQKDIVLIKDYVRLLRQKDIVLIKDYVRLLRQKDNVLTYGYFGTTDIVTISPSKTME
jgi:hypothetical protein